MPHRRRTLPIVVVVLGADAAHGHGDCDCGRDESGKRKVESRKSVDVQMGYGGNKE